MTAARQRGFTLIELMVTVAIVAILAAIAYPSYTQYVRRGHRAAAQSEMMDIANREQQFLLSNRSYADTAALEGSGYRLPPDVAAKYNYGVAVNNVATPPTFTITFTPITTSLQASDGTLVLNSTGLKTRGGDATKW